MSFDLTPYQDPDVIRRVLTRKTVAIVGLSGNDLRASNFVGRYLLRHGYTVIPVNPREKEILGQASYASLKDVPVKIDTVDVFRAPDALPGRYPGTRHRENAPDPRRASRNTTPDIHRA